MTLSTETLVAWAEAATRHYAGKPAQGTPPGLRARDVELAGDVATLIPLLYYVARFHKNQLDAAHPLTIVEIGTADGSTTLPLAKAAGETGGHLHSVDPSGCEDAHCLVHGLGYQDHWSHHKMPSDHFFRGFGDPIDFAFIDGDHRWTVIERDIANCYRLLRPGSMVWVSDYGARREGDAPFDHEYDGPEYVPHVPGSVHEQQSVGGVAKAAWYALPRLDRAQSMCLPLWPNGGCLLVRKMELGELDPLKAPRVDH